MFIGHLHVLFGEISSQGLCPFCSWVVCFFVVELYSCLYTLKIKPSSVTLLANIFSQFLGHLLILFMVSFAVLKLVSFIRYYLFIFVFVSIALGE